MATLHNNLAGGSNGTTLTAGSGGNTGGASGSFFDTAQTVAGGTLAFSSTQAIDSPLALAVATGSTTTTGSFAQWDTSLGTVTSDFGRAYIYLTAAPGSTDALIEYKSAGTLECAIQVTTARQIQIQNAAFAFIHTFTAAIPLNQWVRVEWQVTFSATAGNITVNYYASAESAAVTETYTAGATQNFGASANQVGFGWNNGHANQPLTYLANLAAGASSFPGPAQAQLYQPPALPPQGSWSPLPMFTPWLAPSGPQVAQGQLTNDFEAAIAGTTPANGSGGGGTDAAWDTTSHQAGSVLLIDNTDAANGTQCLHITTDATGETAYVQWSTPPAPSIATQVWFRCYFKMAANQAVNQRIMTMLQGSTLCGFVQVLTTGKLQWIGQTGASVVTTATSVPVGQWVRIEGYLTGASSTGQVELKLWLSANSSGTADETQTSAATAHTTGAPSTYRFGVAAATASADYRIDGAGISPFGYIGPVAGTAQSAGTLSGSGTLGATPQYESGSAMSGSGTLGASPQFAAGSALTGSGTLGGSPALAAAASMSGSGTLAGSAAISVPGAAALSGTGVLAAAPYFAASAALSGSGTLSGPWGISAPSSMTGTGTLAAAPALSGSAALSGSGTLSGTSQLPVTAALSGSGTLSGSPAYTAAAALSGSGTLAVTAGAAGSSSLTGSGTLAASPAFSTAAALSGSGTLAAAPGRAAGSALSGSGTLAAAPQYAGSAALSGSGTLSGPWALSAQAALSGSGTLTAAGAPGASLTGTGTLAGPPALSAAAGMSGSGTLSAAVLLAAAATLAGIGTLSAAGKQVGAGTLAGSGTLAGAPAFQVSASLAGAGTLAGAGQLLQAATSALSGTGTLNGTVRLAGSVTMAGAGTLSFVLVSAGGTLSGSGTLSGAPSVTSGGYTGTAPWAAAPGPARWQASPAELRWEAAPAAGRWHITIAAARWRAGPASPRWRIVMAEFDPIAAVSLEQINITWTSDLDGTRVDPVAGSLTVQFAVPLSSGDETRPAQPATWYPASWLAGGTGKGYIAQGLVGPAAGTAVLVAGQRYDVWGRILGTPEQPAKFAGVQVVY